VSGAVHEVAGGRQLRKTLREAGEDLSDLKEVHKQAATLAANRSKQLAPELTGRLAATIRAAGTKTAGIVRIGNNTRVPYGPAIHWGWPSHNIAPNPFASKGAQQSESTWLPLYERYVDHTLNKIEGT
jgi:hypothetical protein